MMELERQSATAAHWTERQYQRIQTESDAPRRLALVMEEKSTMIAFLIARHLGAEWELENVVVDSAFRRRGAGTTLLDELLTRARAANSESVFLEVRESNQAARALYLKLGFEENGRRKAYYSSPPEDAILHRRSLP